MVLTNVAFQKKSNYMYAACKSSGIHADCNVSANHSYDREHRSMYVVAGGW